MLLQALHQYAVGKKLLDALPFQMRDVHWLIPINPLGEVCGSGLVPLFTMEKKGEKEKEVPGRELLLPRFPGENNGGKAYYLAESFLNVLGLRKDAGEALPTVAKSPSDRNAVRAHQHFWERIQQAHARTNDPRLKALLAFRIRYLSPTPDELRIFGWLRWQPNEASRDKKAEWHGQTSTGDWKPLTKLNTIAFRVSSEPFVVPATEWAGDPCWADWATAYRREAFSEPDEEISQSSKSICLVSGEIGLPVARSHKPKILGIPGLASGGYVVSFATESPAFSSFGFKMGDNAPIAEEVAASYALGLNELLSDSKTHCNIGDVAFCYWTRTVSKVAQSVTEQLNNAKPSVVGDLIKSPFAGIERDVAAKEQFYSVTLSANSGRVVVRDWLSIPLDVAMENFTQWFLDLEIATLGAAIESEDEKAGPLSLFRLAGATVRVPKDLKNKSDVIASLYRAAWQRTAPSVALLQPLLAEFRSALVTDSKQKPQYPFSQSRFALLKLILLRNARKEGFMPKVQLSETDDPAYNLGRLLCVLAALQRAAHENKLEGPGVVERYYGTASTAPANVFGVLWKLHVHHLRKLEQLKTKRKTANRLRGKIADIVAGFTSAGPNLPPQFPRTLSLEEQGRFALGFYQQLAADNQERREYFSKKNSESKS